MVLSWWVWLVGLALPGVAQAHLASAQRGTLSINARGIWLLVPVPVQALDGADEDGDGILSPAELGRHRSQIAARVQAGVWLRDTSGERPLQGLQIKLPANPVSQRQGADHVIATGRFVVDDPNGRLFYRTDLFGTDEEARTLHISVQQGERQRTLTLSVEHPEGELFPGPLAVFVEHVVLGAEHIWVGLDHILFLMVVLAAGGGLRRVLLTLTAFTVGHGITLAASVLWELQARPEIVEPAIAATIVVMAVFDVWRRRRAEQKGEKSVHSGRRLAGQLLLVTGCALIHGLGLAAALQALGDDGEHLVAGLAGFNLGIELAQVGLAAAAGALVLGVKRATGVRGVRALQTATAVVAVVVGSYWFVERIWG